ncbi:MAG TPA: hypothetical protein VHM70_10595 [Polyangiaceae bacterium]|jgi:hypothetical protein|nr:hypothetical protein [Polyangiaceae bacterium]
MSDASNQRPVPVVWEAGGEAQITSSDGTHVVVQSSVPKAPGTPSISITPEGLRYEIKVRTCRRTQEDALPFRVEGRLFNLSAQSRERLLADLRAP